MASTKKKTTGEQSRSRSHCGVGNGDRRRARTGERPAHALPGYSPRGSRMAQKLAEEATEVVIDAVRGQRAAVIHESVDLLYNLVVLWSELGITASEVWAEMDRRQALLGMAGSCQRRTGWAPRPPPSTSEEGGRMLRDALGVSVSVERLG